MEAHSRIWSNREILKQYKRRKWLQWLFLQTICIFGNFHYFAYKYEDSISYEREESYEIEKTYWVMPWTWISLTIIMICQVLWQIVLPWISIWKYSKKCLMWWRKYLTLHSTLMVECSFSCFVYKTERLWSFSVIFSIVFGGESMVYNVVYI